MLQYSMRHRTQLYLDDDQYRWLKRRAARGQSMAEVVRDLIDEARLRRHPLSEDPFIRYLFDDPPAEGERESSVTTIDEDLYE
jgi:hypothetical protein